MDINLRKHVIKDSPQSAFPMRALEPKCQVTFNSLTYSGCPPRMYAHCNSL